MYSMCCKGRRSWDRAVPICACFAKLSARKRRPIHWSSMVCDARRPGCAWSLVELCTHGRPGLELHQSVVMCSPLVFLSSSMISVGEG